MRAMAGAIVLNVASSIIGRWISGFLRYQNPYGQERRKHEEGVEAQEHELLHGQPPEDKFRRGEAERCQIKPEP